MNRRPDAGQNRPLTGSFQNPGTISQTDKRILTTKRPQQLSIPLLPEQNGILRIIQPNTNPTEKTCPTPASNNVDDLAGNPSNNPSNKLFSRSAHSWPRPARVAAPRNHSFRQPSSPRQKSNPADCKLFLSPEWLLPERTEASKKMQKGRNPRIDGDLRPSSNFFKLHSGAQEGTRTPTPFGART